MNEWWANLGARERMLVIVAAVVVALAALYGLAWRPFSERMQRLEQTVAEQRELRAWMESAAQEVQRLRRAGGGPGRTGGGSLLSVADRTAKEAGLGGAVKRVEPEGTGKVRIRLEQAGFDDLSRWLQRLAREFDVRVESITVDGGRQTGIVNARLTLEGAG